MIAYYILVFLFGLTVGSFLNVCIFRIPAGQSIVTPPSHCPACGKRLQPLDLVPLFSYLFLKGSCRYCKARISPRYPLVELLTAGVFLLLFYRYSASPEFLFLVLFMAILTAIFFIDLDHQIIPDELVISALAVSGAAYLFHLFRPLSLYGDTHWWTPLLGMLPGTVFLFLVLLVGLILYKGEDAMGMGDVKIFAPIGLMLGWKLCILALMLSVITGGVISLFLIATGIKKRKDAIPFGPFIVAGTYITLLWGWDILRWYLGG